jgi:hypothetical protein
MRHYPHLNFVFYNSIASCSAKNTRQGARRNLTRSIFSSAPPRSSMSAPPFYTTTRDGRKCSTLNAPPGYGPWLFQDLHEPELTQRLNLMSGAKTSVLSGLRVDSVSFQPCPSREERSQDRIYAGRCDIEGDSSPWSLVGVFDGMYLCDRRR